MLRVAASTIYVMKEKKKQNRQSATEEVKR